MNKKDAYKLVNYLLNEANDLIDIADFTDIKAVSNLLATANYFMKSFRLREFQEIENRIFHIRSKAYEHIEMSKKALDDIFR